MNSTILKLASGYIRGLMLTFAIIALIRGHNSPGGGFIGGLLAGLSMVYKVYSYDFQTARQDLILKPMHYLAIGLTTIILSALPSLVKGLDFMSGVWWKIGSSEFFELKIGTPFIFDIGVFFSVIGVVLLFMFSLNTEDKWK